jgi:uncharacterized protein (DUF2461 family)
VAKNSATACRPTNCSACGGIVRVTSSRSGSLFRIANDLRFARDQPPYKPHLDFAFWEGATGPREDPALIVRLTPADIHLGCGQIGLTGAALAAYRTTLHDPARHRSRPAHHRAARRRRGAERTDPPAGTGRVRPEPAEPAGRTEPLHVTDL